MSGLAASEADSGSRISTCTTSPFVPSLLCWPAVPDLPRSQLDHPCLPKTWNISDDLGQIEYVFSDKTGTLTQNVMEFQKCGVAGIAYGEGITEAMLGAAKREGRDTSAFEPAQNVGHLTQRKQMMIETMTSAFKNRYLQEDKLTLISPSLAEDLTTRSDQQRKLVDFWRALAICHTVIADRSDPDNPNHIEYKAESPDEAALVAAARDVGFVFVSRTNAEVGIEVLGQTERYVPLRVLEFNSSRKRMSTLVRTPDNRILLICKGADSVIYQRLRADHDPEVIASTTRNLEDFANAGLRTLCISSKYVTEDEFGQWSKIYDAACASIEDREDEIERACEMIEGDLTILGATALEDKLQEGVPEAIAQLHKAGLKLWILTGVSFFALVELTGRRSLTFRRRQASNCDRDWLQLQPALERDGDCARFPCLLAAPADPLPFVADDHFRRHEGGHSSPDRDRTH